MSLNNPRLNLPMRSKLFVPGSRPELFVKALSGDADVLSFDLEDSVVASRKAEARKTVGAFLGSELGTSQKLMIVRVNGLSSGLFQEDVDGVVGSRLDVINLPKVESQEDVVAAAEAIANAEQAAGLGRRIAILANIESPKGLRLAYEIATADPRVMGLQIGMVDLSATCGWKMPNRMALDAVRFAVRCAAAEAGIAAFDGAFVDVKNGDAFRSEAEDARNLGFAGKSCVHPSQVPIANEVFAPSDDEVARAETVLRAAAEAKERGAGAFVHDGKMIDVPVIARAQAVVSLAERLGIFTRK